MNSQNQNSMCQKCLEAITGPESQHLDPEMLHHLETCSSCARQLKVFEQLQHEGSAFSGDSFPELKLNIMRRLEPALEQRRMARAAASSTADFSWLWKFVPVLTSVLIVAVLLLNSISPRGNTPALHGPAEISAPSGTGYRLALNNTAPVTVSLDNPVTLIENETAIVTGPDGSLLKVAGPARLNVMPRGFHLLNGHLQAEVVPGLGEFTGTTPHGQITVLGTVFTVDTDHRHTRVAVISGRVKVQADGKEAVLLAAGEKTEISQQTDVSTQTETIPALDKE